MFFEQPARKPIVFLLALSALFSFTSMAQAQLFSSALVLHEGRYEYRAVATATSAAAFVTQANSQGTQSFAFAGEHIFGDPNSPVFSVFGRALDVPTTASYQTFLAVGSPPALVTQLNMQGAAGFRYLGDISYGGVASSLLVRYSAADSFTYKQLPLESTETGFLSVINAQGALGFSFEGNIGFIDSGGNYVVASLFAKNTARNATFSYETQATASNAAALLVQVNAQGTRGFRYRGDIAFGSTVFTISSLYVKDSSKPDRFVFEALTPSASASAFLTQANAQGARNFSYMGDAAFGTTTIIVSSLYVSVRGVIFASGFEP